MAARKNSYLKIITYKCFRAVQRKHTNCVSNNVANCVSNNVANCVSINVYLTDIIGRRYFSMTCVLIGWWWLVIRGWRRNCGARIRRGRHRDRWRRTSGSCAGWRIGRIDGGVGVGRRGRGCCVARVPRRRWCTCWRRLATRRS